MGSPVKTRKQTMRDLKRHVEGRIRREEKAFERLVYGNIGTVKRKKSKTLKSVPAQTESSGHQSGDTGEITG